MLHKKSVSKTMASSIYSKSDESSTNARKPYEHFDEQTSMVTRNPAPDASPASAPTPSKTFTVSR